MLQSLLYRGGAFSSAAVSARLSRAAKRSDWEQLAASATLILGCPRSGTTWLAKIFDSHPDVLYRHEPDEIAPPRPDILPTEQIADWIAQRSLRIAGKRPLFPKSWRPAPLAATRRLLTASLSAGERIPRVAPVARRLGLPDLIITKRHANVRAAVKLVNWNGSAAARAMPDSRSVLILRHPCGQIASVQAGLKTQLFQLPREVRDSSGTVAAYAARHGVARADFEALGDVAKFAWYWRAFNETAVEELGDLPNARIVLYEDLCREPLETARDLFIFSGLHWSSQTEDFISQSTRAARPSGYFDVFRSSATVADQWRQILPEADQKLIRDVVRDSPLARCWPDLIEAA